MKVVSLFDGCSMAQQSLKNLGVENLEYYASEIDKYAQQITLKNHPNTHMLGDVTKLVPANGFGVNMLFREKDSGYNQRQTSIDDVDLLIGGSPCQGFSQAGGRLNFNDDRSKLFFEYVRILKGIQRANPDVKFILENVRMKKEWQDVITKQLGVEPIAINSDRFVPQNRPRLYWTNIPIVEDLPERPIWVGSYAQWRRTYMRHNTSGVSPCLTANMGTGGNNVPYKEIVLKDILESSVDDKFYLSDKAIEYMNRERQPGKTRWEFHTNFLDGKSACLTANMWKGAPYGIIKELKRRLTPIECERLQGLPDNYTEGVSNTQRYKMIGNGFTIPVIEYLLLGLVESKKLATNE